MLSTINLNFELTAIGLAIIATLAVWITLRQLKAQVLSTRAAVLLSLDERIGSQEIREARVVTRELNDKVNEKTNLEWSGLPEAQKASRRSEYYAQLIYEMKQSDRVKYLRLLDSLGFLETMGHVVRFNYVGLEDVYQLFGAMILKSASIFEGHIKNLQEDQKDPSLYEHFMWLAEQTRKRVEEDRRRAHQPPKKRIQLIKEALTIRKKAPLT
jgi:hypothetical protein